MQQQQQRDLIECIMLSYEIIKNCLRNQSEIIKSI